VSDKGVRSATARVIDMASRPSMEDVIARARARVEATGTRLSVRTFCLPGMLTAADHGRLITLDRGLARSAAKCSVLAYEVIL
jgi:hypothetical protein